MTTAIKLLPLLLFPVQGPAYNADCPAQLVNPAHRPSVRCHIPAHVTNYWPYNADGSMMSGWGGQCDSDCSVTATGMSTAAGVGVIAACPDRLIGETVSLGVYGVRGCNDAFGDPDYRNGPFFHERRGVWVVPFDLLQAEPAYDLVWGWEVLP